MQKKSKLKGILVFILSFILISTSFVSLTISRYVTVQNAPFQGEQHLDYTVNSVFVVKNQEELFSAINQGYTYVQLDQNIENPLIITQKAETLNSDLILDLNGIEIQRNGYEPILNIKPGVRLTVIDTSTEQTGGLYNPVGSVFNITGGTLTVVTGTFESGPRYSEYYSYNSQVLNNNTSSITDRTIVENNAQKVMFYEKVDLSDGNRGFAEPVLINAPIIKSYPEKIGNVEYEHGNLYFDTAVTKGDLTIESDTYCYYRTSEDKASDVNNEAAADWYYTYYVDPNDKFNYESATVANEEDFVKITIYGYENTIKQAGAIQNSKDYYAAIQMQSGTLDVQNGGFYSYFGVDRTACVNSQGGNISIKKGKFSSRIPTASTFVQNGVNKKENDELAFDDGYFNNFKWSSHTGTEDFVGNLARQGESYCILNGGNATVTIGTGELYSSNNGIISMHGGELSILGGNFTKRITNGRVTTDNSEMSAIYMKQGTLKLQDASCSVIRNDGGASVNAHAIYMQAGQLDSINTTYNMTGNYSTGIKMLDGRLNVINGDCIITGTNSYGIHSSINSDTDFVINNSSFDIDGANSTGIYSAKGRVNISSDVGNGISVTGANGKGIHVLDNGSVNSINYSYTLSGDGSIGILAESTATAINVKNGDMTIEGAQSYGIRSSITGTDSFTVTDVSILMTGGGTNQTGIYSANGKVTVSTSSSRTISTSGTNGKGIYVTAGGSVDSTNYSYTLSGDGSIGILADSDATGINVVNGAMSVGGSLTYGIKSSITGTTNFTVTDLPISMHGGTNQTGIYSANGKVTVSAGTPVSISTSGANGKGIYVLDGGSVASTNYSYFLTGNNSIGIDAEVDAVSIDARDGTMEITGDNSYGIRSYINDGGSNNKFNVNDISISMTNGENQTGIFSENGRVNVTANTATLISIEGNSGKGIHVSTGGSVVSTNYSYQLSGATSHGIYSTAGLVDISGGDITLDSNQSCYGIYAFSSGNIGVNVTGATIDVGYNAGDKAAGTYRASVGVFLASTNNANKITLTNTNVRCYEIGVLVDGGSLDIKGGASVQNQILTRKASSVVVKDGSVSFDSSCNYVITSYTTRSNNTTNLFNITLPTINESTDAAYDNYDGIYVSGGNFTSDGDIKLTHTGLMNTTVAKGTALSMTTDENLITARSYAIRVNGGNATINKASIIAVQGGGLKVAGGSATFGYEGMNQNDITITTQGVLQTNYLNGYVEQWSYCLSTNGGDAVYITDGNATIYGGIYTAENGNGVWVRGSSTTVVNITGGTYYGKYVDNPSIDDGPNGQSYNTVSEHHFGVFSHSGLKVTHGGTVYVTAGNFNGANGGMILRGQKNSVVNAFVTGTRNGNTYSTEFASLISGKDGVTVFDYSNLYLGKASSSSSEPTVGDGIRIIGSGCAIGVNSTNISSDKGQRNVYIYDGTYTWNGGTSSGTGWYSTNAVWIATNISGYYVRYPNGRTTTG